MASHEFRTPLSAILTSAILINKQNEFGDESKREKYVMQIEKNVNHLTAILNDFLSLSKLEEGEQVSEPTTFDLISFTKLFLKETSIGLKKQQTIIFKSKSDVLSVYLDPKLLTHIFNNLISNASKYSLPGSLIDFTVDEEKSTLLIQITDQGIGIPEEEQQHVFSRFFRAKNAVNVEGTGLGLNIVKHYSELMGGTVTFKSEINKGATFRVEFPNNEASLPK